jgi:RNA polymerase I-specific transcription initiation factor RRN3
MFFPFDPYVLRRSADLLKLHDTYVFWTGSEVDRAVDSESDMEDEDAEEDDMQLSSESEDNELETVSRSSLSDQARSFGVGSLNTRPRKKIFRGLRQPKPLFGRARADGSPHSPGGASGPSPSPASANVFAAMAARWRQTDDPSSLSPL